MLQHGLGQTVPAPRLALKRPNARFEFRPKRYSASMIVGSLASAGFGSTGLILVGRRQVELSGPHERDRGACPQSPA